MLSRNRIKYIQSLTRKKNREIHQCFIAETPKVVNEFLNSSYKTEFIFALEEWIAQHGSKVSESTVITSVTPDELKKISQLKTPHEILAVFKIPESSVVINLHNKITIALDDIQDPGNMGTIIRIADWFGIQNIICSTHTADIYNPKVVQASMGSLAHVNVFYIDLEKFLSETHIPVYATAMEGTSIYKTGIIQEGIVVIGNEGKGISEAILSLSEKRLSIPRIGRAESLNAGIATGIIISHLTAPPKD